MAFIVLLCSWNSARFGTASRQSRWTCQGPPPRSWSLFSESPIRHNGGISHRYLDCTAPRRPSPDRGRSSGPRATLRPHDETSGMHVKNIPISASNPCNSSPSIINLDAVKACSRPSTPYQFNIGHVGPRHIRSTVKSGVNCMDVNQWWGARTCPTCGESALTEGTGYVSQNLDSFISWP